MSKLVEVDWPRSIPGSLGTGVIRSRHSDFCVWEQSNIKPIGAGEHLWVLLQKEGWTTLAAAEVLSRWASVAQKHVGYAGQKDRHAVTEQWFSIHLPGRSDPGSEWNWPEGIQVLQKVRHNKKLRRGVLVGNRFQITIRQCADERQEIERKIAIIAQAGVPNYFTEQRFGRDGKNVQRAKDFFAARKRASRSTRSMLISAARSWLFNQVLAARVISQDWDQACKGDLMMLSGSHSVFLLEAIDAEITQRTQEGDVHPTGPLPGEIDKLNVQDGILELEDALLKKEPDLMRGLIGQRVKSSRRPLRIIPKSLKVRWEGGCAFTLNFELPAGSYATAVLRELFNYRDASYESSAT